MDLIKRLESSVIDMEQQVGQILLSLPVLSFFDRKRYIIHISF